MREIKFRLWTGKEFYFCTLEELMSGDLRACVGYIKQQYTGLKDKNGKEIYEGDILKIFYRWSEDLRNSIIEVKFYDGSFRPFGNGDWDPDTKEIEIIGNIHLVI